MLSDNILLMMPVIEISPLIASHSYVVYCKYEPVRVCVCLVFHMPLQSNELIEGIWEASPPAHTLTDWTKNKTLLFFVNLFCFYFFISYKVTFLHLLSDFCAFCVAALELGHDILWAQEPQGLDLHRIRKLV